MKLYGPGPKGLGLWARARSHNITAAGAVDREFCVYIWAMGVTLGGLWGPCGMLGGPWGPLGIWDEWQALISAACTQNIHFWHSPADPADPPDPPETVSGRVGQTLGSPRAGGQDYVSFTSSHK